MQTLLATRDVGPTPTRVASRGCDATRARRGARAMQTRGATMHVARITAEIRIDELTNLVAASSREERATTRMPALTLEQLLADDAPPPIRAAAIAPAYRAGGTSIATDPRTLYQRVAVIALSAVISLSALLVLSLAILY